MTSPIQLSREAGRMVRTGAVETNYHDMGDGAPIVLLHGSGPGASASSSWRVTMGRLAESFRVVAPDLAGFGLTTVAAGTTPGPATWVQQVVDLLDVLGLEEVSLVGSSLGGAVALGLAIHHAERVDRLVLVGSAGVSFEITPGLDAAWGYEPSEESMGRLLRQTFAYDPSSVSDEVVRARYAASVRPGAHEMFGRLFPAPRQRWVDAMAYSRSEIMDICHPTLLVHGRDDQVIPLSTTERLLEWIEDSQAHIFGRCGHWAQVEHEAAFCEVVADFVDPPV